MTAPRQLRGQIAYAARVGQPYDALIEAEPGFVAATADGHVGSGLVFEPAALRLHGTPVADGYFTLRIQGICADGAAAELTLDLPISPDPWALWQDIPSDQDAPFARPDTAFGALTGLVDARMASRRGRKHAHAGAHREDATGIAQAGRWTLAAVADGAGSAELSREGARVAVEAALDAMRAGIEQAHDPADWLVAALGVAAAALGDLAQREARPVENFATTLMLGALCPPPKAASKTSASAPGQGDAGWQAGCIAVGDGLAAIWDGEGVLAMMEADGGEFAGQTRFLSPQAAAEARARLATLPGLSGFCLMTDGVSDAQFPAPVDEGDPAHWRRLWTEIGGLDAAALCDWLSFRVQGEHDDRSIVILSPPAPLLGATPPSEGAQ